MTDQYIHTFNKTVEAVINNAELVKENRELKTVNNLLLKKIDLQNELIDNLRGETILSEKESKTQDSKNRMFCKQMIQEKLSKKLFYCTRVTKIVTVTRKANKSIKDRREKIEKWHDNMIFPQGMCYSRGTINYVTKLANENNIQVFIVPISYEKNGSLVPTDCCNIWIEESNEISLKFGCFLKRKLLEEYPYLFHFLHKFKPLVFGTKSEDPSEQKLCRDMTEKYKNLLFFSPYKLIDPTKKGIITLFDVDKQVQIIELKYLFTKTKRYAGDEEIDTDEELMEIYEEPE